MVKTVSGRADRSRAIHSARTFFYRGQDAIDVLGGNFAVLQGVGLKLFQHVSGAGHGLFLAPDVDSAVPRRNGNRQRLANSPHVLIASAKERHQFLGTNNRDVCFTHANCAETVRGAETNGMPQS